MNSALVGMEVVGLCESYQAEVEEYESGRRYTANVYLKLGHLFNERVK